MYPKDNNLLLYEANTRLFYHVIGHNFFGSCFIRPQPCVCLVTLSVTGNVIGLK